MILHAIGELGTLGKTPSPSTLSPIVLVAGVFDGVHLGHQILIRRALDNAHYCGAACVVLTFDPHPAKVLRSETAPRLLTSTAHKIRLIQTLGAENFLVLPFDQALATLPAQEFIRRLVDNCHPLREICVGYDWAFGQGRHGNVTLLHELGKAWRFGVTEIGAVEVDGQPVSSTRIRHCITAGDLLGAAKCLGREYTILGTVVAGEGMGRKIGFPTANLASHNEIFPPDGVYAVRAEVGGSILPAVANIGMRPTLSVRSQRLLEVHLLDTARDLYGMDLEIRFEAYLRPERQFSGWKALAHQITCDITQARNLLK